MPRKQLPPHLQPGTVVSALPPDEPGDWKEVMTPEGPAYVRRLTQEERTRSELATGLGTFQILTAPTDIGAEKALSLKGELLDERRFTLLLDRTGMVLKPDGEVLCIRLRDRLSREMLDKIRPVVRKAARNAVAGANRTDAAGAGRVARERADGSKAKMTGTPSKKQLKPADFKRLKNAKDGTFGYNSRGMRGGQVYPCRITRYDGALPSELKLMAEFAREVGDVFRNSFAQQRWEAQFQRVLKTPLSFVIRTPESATVFTTITCNKSWRTAAHTDTGDLKEGFGVLACLGDFEGCDLVFPRYKTAARYREGDVLLADVHEVHGNTPLLNPDGTTPKLDEEPERLVTVFYYQEKMDRCLGTPEEEMEFVNNRKKGDPMF
jgi:hypothetical protein